MVFWMLLKAEDADFVNITDFYFYTVMYFVVNLETEKTIVITNPEEFTVRIWSFVPFHQDKISGWFASDELGAESHPDPLLDLFLLYQRIVGL